MTTLLASTIHRQSDPGAPTGSLHTVDIADRRVRTCPVPEPEFLELDPNPRGGMRGAKGITIHGDTVYTSNHSEIFQFDRHWRLLNTISHPACAHIHDILADGEALWVTSCRNDLLIRFSLAGQFESYVNIREHRPLLKTIGWTRRNLLTRDQILNGSPDFRDPRSHLFERYNGVHLNSICLLADGSMLLSLGLLWNRRKMVSQIAKNTLQNAGMWGIVQAVSEKVSRRSQTEERSASQAGVLNPRTKSAIVRIAGNGESHPVLEVPDTTVPIHSLLALDDGSVVFDDTNTGELVQFDPDNPDRQSRFKVSDEYLRGLTRLPDGSLAVGSQCNVKIIDLERRRVLDTIPLSGNRNESVYDVKVLPSGFDPLPEKLPR